MSMTTALAENHVSFTSRPVKRKLLTNTTIELLGLNNPYNFGLRKKEKNQVDKKNYRQKSISAERILLDIRILMMR